MKLSDLFVKLRLDNKQYNSELKESGNKTKMFGNGIKKIGGLIAGAFAIHQVADFAKELVHLGGVAEGVESAFLRMADAGVLDDLRRATSNTISDLELMQRAVSAQNLGLPIKNLASLFEFATKRAQETGESVDFLVNSIVTGIGRKSPLILDNLGISAIQLREKLKGVGMESASVAEVAAAVGEIAADSMRESGEVIETNAIKIDQLRTAWENFKKELADDEEFKQVASGLVDAVKNEIELLPESIKVSLRALSFVFRNRLKKDLDESVGTPAQENAKKLNQAMQTVLMTFKALGWFTSEFKKETGLTREEWDKLNEAFLRTEELSMSVSSSFDSVGRKLDELSKKSEDFMSNWMKPTDVSGIVGGGGVFDMFGPDIGEQDLGGITSFYLEQEQKAKEFLETMNSIMASGIGDFISTFAEGFGRLAAGDIGFEEFGNAILSQIGSFLKMFGEALLAYGLAEQAFLTSFNPGVKIAAGVALIALGGLIGGLSRSGVTGGGGGGSAVGGQAFNVVTTNAQDQQLVAKVSGRDLDFVMTKYNSDRSRR